LLRSPDALDGDCLVLDIRLAIDVLLGLLQQTATDR
jgi:hypothetical protein